jgi:hypothetical protein
MAYLLKKGTPYELRIIALLYPYVFSSASALLQLLREQFTLLQPKRTTIFLSNMIENHWQLLGDHEVENTLKSLILRTKELSLDGEASLKSLFRLEEVQSAMSAIEAQALARLTLVTQLAAAPPPAPTVPVVNFEDIAPKDAAQALTFLDTELFSAIPLTELMRKNFSERHTSPQLHRMIDRYNNMANGIMAMIISPPDRATRAAMIRRWVAIGQACLGSHNYFSLLMIITALDHINVTRLKSTWEALPQEVNHQFEALFRIVTPTQNYSNYRAAMAASPPHSIPILPAITKDLFQIEELRDTFVKHRHLCMQKLHKLHEIISTLAINQAALLRQYTEATVNPAVVAFFRQMGTHCEWTEDGLYQLSLDRESPAARGGQRNADDDLSSSGFADLKKNFFGRLAAAASSASLVASPSPPPSASGNLTLKIRVVGTTPAFQELGFAQVTKTVVLQSSVTDSFTVMRLLYEKLYSTMRPLQIELFQKEAGDYVLYEERERGRLVPITLSEKPWHIKESLVISLERDRSKPKLSHQDLMLLKLEYENALLKEELRNAHETISQLELQLHSQRLRPTAANSSSSS